MMNSDKAVVLEQAEILCGLGTLEETVADLFENECAIAPGPCYGVDTRYAPFKDPSWHGLGAAARRLAAAFDASLLDKDKTVFLFCAAKGDITPLEEHCMTGKKPVAFLPLLSSQADYVKTACSIPACRTIVVSNACASGAIGVEIAAELLSSGRFENAVLFGFDSVTRFVATGFNALSALSPAGARPFDARRDGLTLGEGACIAVVTYRTPFADDVVVAGCGSSNDANHRTGPSRTGDGLHRAAQAALRDAGMWPSSVGAVKCHGTATNYNDAMEAKAIFSLFREEIPPCFSIKGAIGHTSGAGSLLELCVAAECLRRRRVPPTCGYSERGVDEPIPVSASARHLSQQSILCLSAGFGGINAAVVLGTGARHQGPRSMSAVLYCESFSALLPEGIITPGGLRPWAGGQDGPADVTRGQVLDKPYPSFGKLSLPDRLAFSAAALALSACPVGDKESAGIFLGLPAGSISTDLRYMESMLAGFPGPALFSATLPSSAIADVAIFFGLKGENRVIAGGPESGLAAFDCACAMLAAGKAGPAIVLSVNAVESKDVSSPLLPAGFDTQNRAYAFLLSAGARPAPGGAGRRIEVSFDHCNKDLPGERGELYFYNLMQLLRGPSSGSIEFNVHGISGRMTVLKD